MAKPSSASKPTTSRSKPFSVGDGVRKGALGVFGVVRPPDAKPKATREISSTVVPNKCAARWAACGFANWYLLPAGKQKKKSINHKREGGNLIY